MTGGYAKTSARNLPGLLFTKANFEVVDTLREVSTELERPMSQVALSWAARRPGLSSVLMGASRAEQLTQNIGSLDIEFTFEQQARLDGVSAPPMLNPYFIFNLPRARIFGGQNVQAWGPGL